VLCIDQSVDFCVFTLLWCDSAGAGVDSFVQITGLVAKLCSTANNANASKTLR